MRRAIRWSLLLVLWVSIVWELVPIAVLTIDPRDCLQGWECYHSAPEHVTLIGAN